VAEGGDVSEGPKPPSRDRKAFALAVRLYLGSEEGVSRVTSKLGPLFQQIGDMMNSRTLFEFNSSLLDSTLRWRCAASLAGRQRVRRGDYIVHLTTRPVNRGLPQVVDDSEIGQGLEFVIRPSRYGGGVEHEEEEAYRFVGYCHSFGLTDGTDWRCVDPAEPGIRFADQDILLI